MSIAQASLGRRAGLLSATAATALLGGIGAARAEAPAAAPASAQIQEVVVTAQRRSQNIQDVPVSIQALNSKDLQAAGIKSTQDLGQVTPNVTIISPIGQGNQPLITIRGIGLNDFDTNNAGPNGVYVDDVYISAPSAQSFATFDLAQVQVLKGPQGTLYGRNTSGGALVFTSNKPTDRITGDLHLEYGAFNTLQVAGAIGGPIAQNLTGRIAVVVNHSDGYTSNAYTGGSAIDNVNNESVRLQLLYKPNDRLKLYFETMDGYVHNRPQPYGHIGVYQPGTQGDAAPVMCTPAQALAGGCVDLFGYGTARPWAGSFNRLQQLTNFVSINQIRADYDFGPAVLTSISSYQWDDKFHPEETDASPNNLLSATYGVKSSTVTQEFRLAHNSHDFNWVVGTFYLHETLRQDQPLDLFGDGDLFGGFGIPAGPGAFDGIAQRSYDHSKQVTDSFAVFGQGDYTWRQLTLTLGGRYTWEKKSFTYSGSTQYQAGGLGNYGPLQDFINYDNAKSWSNVTWRAALSYHFTREIQAYASASTGFKSGGFNGSFLSNDSQQAALQLQPIKPEKVTAYEIGEKATLFDHRLNFNLAGFYNDYRDEQIFAAVPQTLQTGNGTFIETTTQLLTNARKAHTEGVEMQITATPVHGLTIDLQSAWLRAKLDDGTLPLFTSLTSLSGKDLANAPHFTFSGVLDYKLGLSNDNDINFRWNSNYRSHVWFDSTNDPYIQQSPYWVHNLNIDFESHQGWVAGVFVHNVANAKYALTSTDLSAPFGLLEPVYGPPRTYGVELGYHF
ncbi:TonB-dependent receptor [Caulobacter sp. KR2-114]|uniref:TonB-dependent receptor n=1 Tax=Caulobacter sp. KR2-114 TaxID=3400912 RepID=UPI003C08C24C